MQRDAILSKLRERSDVLKRFGVCSIALFGSAVRDEADDNSDIDLLVDFEPDRTPGLLEFIVLKETLESDLGHSVDLVTRDALHPRLRERILQESVNA